MKMTAHGKRESAKRSGADWLGEVPADWAVKKMKYLFRDHSQKGRPNADLLSVTQDQGVVPRSWVENRMVMPSGALKTFKFIEKGDFAISLRSFEGGLEYCHHDGIISPAYTVLKAWHSNLAPGYYRYLFKSNAFISELQTSVVGIREGKNISFPELSHSLMPIPPVAEQVAIANFLDEKCAKVDEAVRIKEEQIALLRERRQILIQEAVTRGLNPDAPMKDSGIDWIGEIPEQWEVKRFTKEVCVQEGPGIMAADFQDKGVPLVRISGVRTRVVTLEGCNYLEPAKVRRKWEHFLLKEGDLVISGSASTGLVAEVGKEAIGAVLYTGLMKLRIINSDALSKSYLEFFLSSKAFDTQVDLLKAGSTISHYGPSHLGKMFIIVPPWDEQIEVATYCAGESERIESAIAIKNEQIAALREYKTTLINAAVTGKIKVA